MVSAAIWRAPGTAAFNFSCGAAGIALAATGGVTAAAAPTRPAPLRKLRRLESGKWRRLDMASSQGWRKSREKIGSFLQFGQFSRPVVGGVKLGSAMGRYARRRRQLAAR